LNLLALAVNAVTPHLLLLFHYQPSDIVRADVVFFGHDRHNQENLIECLYSVNWRKRSSK
jgi:hypothetical protein